MSPPVIHLMQDRTRVVFDPQRISKRLAEAVRGLEASVSVEELTEDVIRSVFDGISVPEVYRAQILAARSRIERDPAYGVVTAKFMLNVIYQEALVKRLMQERSKVCTGTGLSTM